jgi:hypothetical protein
MAPGPFSDPIETRARPEPAPAARARASGSRSARSGDERAETIGGLKFGLGRDVIGPLDPHVGASLRF